MESHGLLPVTGVPMYDDQAWSRQGRRWTWIAAALLAVAFAAGYSALRPQIFTWLAAGTDWVLIVCGFQAPDEAGPGVADERLRKLYYAARMFEAVPPRELIPLDAWADRTYPGMGFGVTRTFDNRPATVIIGGWRFDIPCTYFADARDCGRAGLTSARLKVEAADLSPISPHRIEEFLAAASPDILRISLADSGSSQAPGSPYHAIDVRGQDGALQTLHCIDQAQASASQLLPHCLLRASYSADVELTLYFAADRRPHWETMRGAALALISDFQARR